MKFREILETIGITLVQGIVMGIVLVIFLGAIFAIAGLFSL